MLHRPKFTYLFLRLETNWLIRKNEGIFLEHLWPSYGNGLSPAVRRSGYASAIIGNITKNINPHIQIFTFLSPEMT